VVACVSPVMAMTSVSTEWPVEQEEVLVSEGTEQLLIMVGAQLGGFAFEGTDLAQDSME
jgi:hypothetical protein